MLMVAACTNQHYNIILHDVKDVNYMTKMTYSKEWYMKNNPLFGVTSKAVAQTASTAFGFV